LAVAVDDEIVHARVGADLDERPDAGLEVVAHAQRAAILVEIAVVVARGGAVGEARLLPHAAIEGALGGDLETVEALRIAERAAERGDDRQAAQSGLDVRAARVVGADEQPPLEVDMAEARGVEPAVDA